MANNADYGYSMRVNPFAYLVRAACDCGWSRPHNDAAPTPEDGSGTERTQADG